MAGFWSNATRPPFLGGMQVVVAPLLKNGTAIALQTSDLAMRVKRPPDFKERGSRGDMYEGDWLFEGAIDVLDQQHGAWLDGITGFAA